MPEAKRVEFTALVKQFRHAVKELMVNREEFKGTDRATLTIHDGELELSAVGTETVIEGVDGENGSARVPVKLLEKIVSIAETYKHERVRFAFEPRVALVEKFKIADRGISIPTKPEKPSPLPVNASNLDVLAVRAALDDLELEKSGLKVRVRRALEAREAAVEQAWEALREFGVDKEEVFELVTKHIQAMAKGAKRALAAE
jgi:hypothetical protein